MPHPKITDPMLHKLWLWATAEAAKAGGEAAAMEKTAIWAETESGLDPWERSVVELRNGRINRLWVAKRNGRSNTHPWDEPSTELARVLDELEEGNGQ